MTPGHLPGAGDTPPKPPQSIGQLSRIVLSYVRKHGQAEKRTRDWISNMTVAAMLAQTGGGGKEAHFTLKGGVALEMRLDGRARATRDVDFSYRGPATDDLVSVIDDALSRPYGRFTFERTGRPLDMTRVGTIRVEVKVRFNGSEWGTVSMDVSRQEDAPIDIEMVDAFDIHGTFGLDGPDQLPCLSLHDHMAQKIHGMTRPGMDGKANERVQDAIDVLLFLDQFANMPARMRLRTACELTFSARDTHAWPPSFEPPPFWRDDFSTMAAELGLAVTDLDDATEKLQAFIRLVANSTPSSAA